MWVLVSCGSATGPDGGPSGGAGSALVGTWKVSSLRVDGAARPIVPGTNPTVEFDKAGSVSIVTGCNRVGGKVRITSDTITADGGLMQTLMACEPDRMEQEAVLVKLLGTTARYTLDSGATTGDVLTITGGGVDARLAR